MICQDCGHDYPSALPRCRKCGRLTPRRSQSRLIQFPRQPNVSTSETAKPVQPAWRSELSEKVRAIRARRSVEAAARPVDSPQPAADAEKNPIVEAALTRVQRASRGPARTTLPLISQSHGQERAATARALAAKPDVSEPESPDPVLPPSRTASSKAAVHDEVAGESIQPALYSSAPHTGTDALSEPAPEQLVEVEPPSPETPAQPAPKPDPLDYLTAEIRKVDEALGLELSRIEAASRISHLITGFIDAIVIGAAAAPFLAVMASAGADFQSGGTQLAAAVVLLVVSFFYLALTHSFCGRTFGMMFTNTRVVDAVSFNPLSVKRALMRVAGYYVAALPVAIGLFWTLVDRKHRGWHDLMAGTLVIADY